jgi:YesN/AraC family two-component response regulator
MFWVAMLMVLALAAIVLWGGKRDKSNDDKQNRQEQKEALNTKQLMQRITELIERQQLYLNSELKLKDVADALEVSTVKVSRCINKECKVSFIQLVNRYRVKHAQQMMLSQPDEKLTTVAMESGFANETSFYRTFKATTDLSPKEWLTSQK